MTIEVFSMTGAKKGTWDLPEELFDVRVNEGLIHQFVTLQQSNRRIAIAHAKSRGEVQGSTHKLYAQKHTGRARRGASRSPLLRGGGKAFGPKSIRNFTKDMPRAMRHAALRAALSMMAKRKAIFGLEGYPEAIKTKDAIALLKKLPVDIGRRIVFIVAAPHKSLTLSTRNIPNVSTLLASYLNPESIVSARSIVFLEGSLEKAQEVFGKKKRDRTAGKRAVEEVVEPKKKPLKSKMLKTAVVKKKTTTTKKKKASSPSA